MNTFDKIRSFCRGFRILAGVVILGLGFYFNAEEEMYIMWFFVVLALLLAGLSNFCP